MSMPWGDEGSTGDRRRQADRTRRRARRLDRHPGHAPGGVDDQHDLEVLANQTLHRDLMLLPVLGQGESLRTELQPVAEAGDASPPRTRD